MQTLSWDHQIAATSARLTAGHTNISRLLRKYSDMRVERQTSGTTTTVRTKRQNRRARSHHASSALQAALENFAT